VVGDKVSSERVESTVGVWVVLVAGERDSEVGGETGWRDQISVGKEAYIVGERDERMVGGKDDAIEGDSKLDSVKFCEGSEDDGSGEGLRVGVSMARSDG